VLGGLVLCFELRSPVLEVTFDESEGAGLRFWCDMTVQWGSLHGWVAITEEHTALMMLVPADICSGSLVHNGRATESKIGLVLGSSHAQIPFQAGFPAFNGANVMGWRIGPCDPEHTLNCHLNIALMLVQFANTGVTEFATLFFSSLLLQLGGAAKVETARVQFLLGARSLCKLHDGKCGFDNGLRDQFLGGLKGVFGFL